MTKHIKTKRKILDTDKVSFNELLDLCMISEEDKEILRMIYIEKKTLSYIADTKGYTLSAIKSKHRKLVSKISKLI